MKTNKKSKNLIGIIQSFLILILVVLIIFMMIQISRLQGTARVINYAGLVRGATQREIKLEITGNQNDELIKYLDDILLGLRYQDGHYDLVKLNDEEYQEKLQIQSDYWDKLKTEIEAVCKWNGMIFNIMEFRIFKNRRLKMRKKIVNSLITATVIGSMLTGMAVPCFAGEKKDDGSSITVLVESGSPAEALANDTAADFEKETGCKVVVDAVAYTGMYDKLSTEIKAGQAAHDVSCMDFIWLAAFADAIEPITDADTSDFLPTLEESGTVDGNLLGYPMWVNAKILIYRKDLIPEDKVPKTWDEYKALAKEMKTDDMYGTTVFGSGSDAVCSFLDFACQAGADGLVYDKDGNVNITDQPYVDALDFMVEMANEDCTPSDSLATASTESQELFNNGKVAMQLNWSHQYPAAVEALGADKVGCAPMIAGSAGAGATTGPWYECVMKNSENKDMALKYVEYMYDHNADYMNGTLKIAGRTSVYEEAGKEAGNEHTTAVLDTLNEKQSQPRPMISTWSQVEQVLTGVVESCLGGADVKETLESAKEEIEAIGK